MCSSAIFFASAWHSFFLLSLVSQHYRIVFGFFVLFLSVVFLQLARFFFLRFLLSVGLLGPRPADARMARDMEAILSGTAVARIDRDLDHVTSRN